MFKLCNKSYIQEYQCQVFCNVPWRDKPISFDMCLTGELKYLWSLGIKTTGCCCGKHKDCQEDMSYIGVEPEYIEKMKELGYKVSFNPMRPKGQDSFVPKIMKEVKDVK